MKTKFVEIPDTDPMYMHIYRWIQCQVPESYKNEFRLSYNQFMRKHKIKVINNFNTNNQYKPFRSINLIYRLPEELFTFIIMSATNV